MRRGLFIGMMALLALVPAHADNQVAEPGLTTPLLFTGGTSAQSPSGATGQVDIPAGVIRAEAYSTTEASTASATATVWTDFTVGGSGGGELGAKVFANAGWKGAWQADAAGATATAKITARLLELGAQEPILVAVTTVAAAGVDPSFPPCAGCYGITIPEVGEDTIEFDRPLKKGSSYRLAIQIDVVATNPGNATAKMDFLGEIPGSDNAGVAVSGVGIALEDDVDAGDEFDAINAKLDALSVQLEEAVTLITNRFDAVDAQLVLTNIKLDNLAGDVSGIDDKLNRVLSDLNTVITGILDLRVVTCDLERLVMTPDGQRASEVGVCEGQPGFPYDWPEPRLNDSNNGSGGNNGNAGNNGNGGNNGNAGNNGKPRGRR